MFAKKKQHTNDGACFFLYQTSKHINLYDNNSNDEGMITGYYEPLLYGSLKNSKV